MKQIIEVSNNIFNLLNQKTTPMKSQTLDGFLINQAWVIRKSTWRKIRATSWTFLHCWTQKIGSTVSAVRQSTDAYQTGRVVFLTLGPHYCPSNKKIITLLTRLTVRKSWTFRNNTAATLRPKWQFFVSFFFTGN